MKHFISITVILLLVSGCSKKVIPTIDSQASDIQTVEIHAATFSVGPCEPSICISSQDPNIVAAGSILDNYYLSTDGGMTWSQSRLRSTHGVYGDPVLRMADDNTLYYAHLANPTGRAYVDKEFLNKIVVQRSDDLGKTWTNGSWPPCDTLKDHDKQWLYIPPQSDEVFMSWTEFDQYGSKDPKDKSRILFSKSDDKATSWTPAIAISDQEGDCIDGDQTTEGALPLKLNNGDILVSWSYDEKIWLDRSTDGGITWSKDQIIADQPGGWTFDVPGIGRCNGMPIIDSDRSQGEHHGNIYVNWSDQRNGTDDTDIWIIKSIDDGFSWSEPIRVNDDLAGKHQFFCWMDVDPVTGYIYIVFYDRRDHDDTSTDVYLAYSKDGAETFTNIKISAQPFTPNTLIFFGDYNDIAAHNGIVRPIWTTLDKGRLSVHTALIQMDK